MKTPPGHKDMNWTSYYVGSVYNLCPWDRTCLYILFLCKKLVYKKLVNFRGCRNFSKEILEYWKSKKQEDNAKNI